MSLNKRSENYATASGNSGVAWMGENTDYVAAAGDDACVTLWLTSETGTQPKAILKEHDDIVSSLATNPQQRDNIASGSWDAKIKLWNLGREESVETLEGHFAAITCLEWHNSSEQLLFSSSQDTTAKQWDVRQKGCVSTFHCQSPILTLQANPQDEHTLITGEEDATIHLHDIRKPGQATKLAVQHEDAIRRLCFSPHQPSLLACASDDTTITVLDLSTRSTVARFVKHTDFVRALAWDVDNRGTLFSGGWDKKVFSHVLNLS